MNVINAWGTGNNIRNFMDDAGYSTKDVQDLLGFTTTNAIYKWFAGKSLPTVENLVVLANAFDVKVDDLIAVN